MQAILDKLQANKELQAVATQFGLTLRDLMYDQGRLIAQDAIKRSPPGKRNQGVQKQRAQGIKDVTTDLKKAFWPTDYEEPIENWHNRLDEKGYEIFVETKNGKKKLDRKSVLLDASMQEMRKIHKKYRNAKGKVRFPYDKTKVAAGKYAVPKKTFNRYLKAQIKKIGNLKAGFLPGADHFAGLGNTTTKAVPAWVRKQTNKTGTHINNVNKKTGTGGLVIINNVDYAETAITKGFIAQLEHRREQDIKKQAMKRIRQLTRKHNEKYARAA